MLQGVPDYGLTREDISEGIEDTDTIAMIGDYSDDQAFL